ncbi:MAG: alpha-galactosidase [Bacteroidales bacterium]|nr:alpha-galactosidase [Bacteroidales bacterium]
MKLKLITAGAAAIFLAVALSASAKEVIKINTASTQMVLVTDKDAPVQFYYWGEKIAGDGFADRFYKKRPDSAESCAPQLYPAYGGSMFLTPAMRVTGPDGSLVSELVFDSCLQESAPDGARRTVIVLKDKVQPIEVRVRFDVYEQYDVIAQSAELVNKGRKTLTVHELASSFLPLHSGSYYLSHFGGTWAHERQWEEERLTRGSKIIESKKGVRTTQADSPSFAVSLDAPLQEYSGQVYAGTLAWSGNYRLSFQLDEYGILDIVSGINPFASDIRLDGGKSLETPRMLLSYSPDGMNRISRNFHDWGRRYGLAHGDALRPVVLNSWEGAYFNFDEKTLTDMMDRAAEFGIEMFVLDDGWFGNEFPRNGDNAGLGDWQVNSSKLPRGISYLASYAVSKGLKFGIWIEPEMVNPNSNLAHAHPDWIVGSGNGRENPTMRNQWLLDLTNPKVQDFVVKTFNDVMAMSPDISYIKWDANRHVENIYSPYLPKDRQSHFWYEYTRGLYSVYDRVRAAHPDVQIQLCSSGGGRVDYGAMKYHDEYWASDNTNPVDRLLIQYGDSFFFPVEAAGSHVSASPNHQTGLITPLKFRFDVAMTGRLGMELQPSNLSAEEQDYVKKMVAAYKELRPVIHHGDQYRLISPYDDGGYSAEMFVSKDRCEAVFFAFSMKYHGRTEYLETRFRGLDPEASYIIEEVGGPKRPVVRESGSVLSGDYLMKAGLNINMVRPFDSVVLRLVKVN